MAGIGKKLGWALLGAVTTKVARNAAGRALHTGTGSPRLPARARGSGGLRTALLWAAGTGIVLAVSDLLREQRKDVSDRS